MPAHDPAPVPAFRKNTKIRAQNGNIGAVIVAVPRNLGVVRQRIAEATNFNGHNWEYRLPFKTKNNDGEFVNVTGPTVKCALDIARAYGNCNVEIDGDIRETPEAWYFNASITDLESGSRLARPFRQRKNQNVGGKMDAICRQSMQTKCTDLFIETINFSRSFAPILQENPAFLRLSGSFGRGRTAPGGYFGLVWLWGDVGGVANFS